MEGDKENKNMLCLAVHLCALCTQSVNFLLISSNGAIKRKKKKNKKREKKKSIKDI